MSKRRSPKTLDSPTSFDASESEFYHFDLAMTTVSAPIKDSIRIRSRNHFKLSKKRNRKVSSSSESGFESNFESSVSDDNLINCFNSQMFKRNDFDITTSISKINLHDSVSLPQKVFDIKQKPARKENSSFAGTYYHSGPSVADLPPPPAAWIKNHSKKGFTSLKLIA